MEVAEHTQEAACLSEARTCLLKAAVGPKSNATVLANLLLAEGELLGNKKKKEERMQQYLKQVGAMAVPNVKQALSSEA